VRGGKPNAVLLQFISGVSAINPIVAFYDIHGGKKKVLFFYFVPKLIINLNPFYLSSQFQSKFVFECANYVSTSRVVTYNIWTQIEDRYVN
jgi:hypothetical protein